MFKLKKINSLIISKEDYKSLFLIIVQEFFGMEIQWYKTNLDITVNSRW
jgi:hypothetical protein